VRGAEKGGGLILNIGTGLETSVQELYDLMAKLTDFRQPAQYQPPRTGELQRSAVDASRAGMQLGWKPFTSLEEGLALTLEHFKNLRDAAR
jgi:UDP-glucose 4-epimerase